MNKNLNKEILNIGVPVFLETLFTAFAAIIDSKMVASMGVSAISAVSVTNQPRLFIFSIFFAIHTVTTSLIAKYYGKDNRVEANKVFNHVIKLTIILSLALGLLSALLARPVMILFSGQKDTLESSLIYFRIVMAGMIFNLLYMTVNSALRGIGKTKLTFADNVLSCAVNLFFNYLLIDGHFGFPALGIAGAATATVLGNAAALVMSLVFACNRELYINIPFCFARKYRMTIESLKEISSLTKSCTMDNLNMRFALLLISGISARIGSYQMAVYSIGNYLLNINFALGTGLQTSAVTLIGRAYGKENYYMINKIRIAITNLGLIFSTVLSILIAAGGRLFFSFFSQEQEFIAMGTSSAVFIGVITVSQTLKFIFNGCLQGMGMMKQSMFCSLVAFSAVNLGSVALSVLILDMGIRGVWVSTFLCQTVHAMMLYYFIRHTRKGDRQA
ncbi:MAG: MATE family efflux transporter [Synergistaceae bacterium]|nr:MATE family efflux transporter [Synergistaceae bacterium]MBR0095709.1 MATE family efflux transporter [Synergistaceae bacterium]MBR0184437.1 MATE family efflux transporter [Synergistaceae bacterium]